MVALDLQVSLTNITQVRLSIFEEKKGFEACQGAQLVKANARICGRGARSWVRFVLLVECPGLFGASYG